MRQRHAFVVLVASCAFVLSCGPGPAMDLQMPPPPPPLPEKTPPPVQVWEGTVVETVCLDVEWSLPQVSEDAIGPADVPRVLTNMGLKVVDEGAACDATLSIELSGEASGAAYGGLGYCVTGGIVQGKMTLSAEGRDPFTAPIWAVDPVDNTVTEGSCSKDPDRYDLNVLCLGALEESLAQIWGLEVYVWMSEWAVWTDGIHVSPPPLRHVEIGPEIIDALLYALENEGEPTRRAAARRLGDYAPDGEEAIPYLIGALSDWEDGAWEAYAEALGEFGPQAMDAVPVLIIALRDEIPEAWKRGALWVSPDYKGKPADARYPDILAMNQLKAIDVLKEITGEDHGTDVDAWARWWSEQQ